MGLRLVKGIAKPLMKRRFLKIRVLALLMAVTCCAIVFAWVSSNLSQQKRESKVLDEFTRLTASGVSVSHTDPSDHHYGPFYSAYIDKTPSSSLGSIASIVWPDAFHRIVRIELNSPHFNDTTLELLKTLSHLKQVTVSDSRISKHALDDFAKIRPNVELEINDIHKYEDHLNPGYIFLASVWTLPGREELKQSYARIKKKLQEADGDLLKLNEELQTVIRITTLLCLNDDGQTIFQNDFPDNPPYSVFVNDLKRLNANEAAERFEAIIRQFDLVDLHLRREQRNRKIEIKGDDAGFVEHVWYPESALDLDDIRHKLNEFILMRMDTF